jgi:hypothetical protein
MLSRNLNSAAKTESDSDSDSDSDVQALLLPRAKTNSTSYLLRLLSAKGDLQLPEVKSRIIAHLDEHSFKALDAASHDIHGAVDFNHRTHYGEKTQALVQQPLNVAINASGNYMWRNGDRLDENDTEGSPLGLLLNNCSPTCCCVTCCVLPAVSCTSLITGAIAKGLGGLVGFFQDKLDSFAPQNQKPGIQLTPEVALKQVRAIEKSFKPKSESEEASQPSLGI